MIPTRPVIRWYGGKWKVAPWIVGHLPPHLVYVEPFGGGASVLLQKRPTQAEIYNDLDGDIVNLFKVLRSDYMAPALIEALELTPYAREEFVVAYEETDDPVERARRLLVRAFMGPGSRGMVSRTATSVGFNSSSKRAADSKAPQKTHASDWRNYPATLPPIIERLRGVIIERRPAVDVIVQHDTPETLHYLDPPYMPELRAGSAADIKHRLYRHELTRREHISLLKLIGKLQGMVVISGYPSDLYDTKLKDWRRVQTETHADGARDRTEVLWINPRAAEALDRSQMSLFASLDREKQRSDNERLRAGVESIAEATE